MSVYHGSPVPLADDSHFLIKGKAKGLKSDVNTQTDLRWYDFTVRLFVIYWLLGCWYDLDWNASNYHTMSLPSGYVKIAIENGTSYGWFT
jgi:hypothetical protein